MLYLWKGGGALLVLPFSLPPFGFQGSNLIVNLDCQHLYLVDHLDSLNVQFWFWFFKMVSKTCVTLAVPEIFL